MLARNRLQVQGAQAICKFRKACCLRLPEFPRAEYRQDTFDSGLTRCCRVASAVICHAAATPACVAVTGPPSSVQLATTYLDDRVRLGKGSRGSLFVFTRGGAADAAGEQDTDRFGLARAVIWCVWQGGLGLQSAGLGAGGLNSASHLPSHTVLWSTRALCSVTGGKPLLFTSGSRQYEFQQHRRHATSTSPGTLHTRLRAAPQLGPG